jgi:ribosomal-protein-alanine N-acetyltransferase
MAKAQIETPRTRLVPWEEDDWAPFQRLCRDPRVMRHIWGGALWNEEKAREFVARQRRCLAERGYCMWKVTAPHEAGPLGLCGLQPLAGTDEIEIGWWLVPELWGQGIATEAARAVLRFGFEDAALGHIAAVAMPDNGASIRIMEKLGMSLVGPAMHKGHAVVKYSIARERFDDLRV